VGQFPVVLVDSKTKAASVIEESIDIGAIYLQMIVREVPELSMRSVPLWDVESDLATWNGEVGIGLNTLARHFVGIDGVKDAEKSQGNRV
jgi:hypothetical protein